MLLGKFACNADQRDAVHVAVAPIVAGVELKPAQHVGLDEEGKAVPSNHPIGIVDPFLKCSIWPGMVFWLMLYPNTVISMRHEWDHPAFPTGDSKRDSAVWIESFAQQMGQTCDDLMTAANDWAEFGEYYVVNHQRYQDFSNESFSQFWKHWSVVTGNPIPSGAECFFACSC